MTMIMVMIIYRVMNSDGNDGDDDDDGDNDDDHLLGNPLLSRPYERLIPTDLAVIGNLSRENN